MVRIPSRAKASGNLHTKRFWSYSGLYKLAQAKKDEKNYCTVQVQKVTYSILVKRCSESPTMTEGAAVTLPIFLAGQA
jgi:hypothetical protein